MTVDRRKQKTREALRLALSDLLREHSYDAITIQDLAIKANISRSTFYIHFRDKDDLLISGFEEIGVHTTDDIFQENDKGNGYPNFAIVLFRGAENWSDMARVCLCAETPNAAAMHMHNMVIIKTRDWLRESQPRLPSADLESSVQYLAGALMGLLTWWVRTDFPYPAEEMSDKFNRLAAYGLQGLLHPDENKT